MAKVLSFQDAKNQKALADAQKLITKASFAYAKNDVCKLELIHKELDNFISSLDDYSLDFVTENLKQSLG